MYPSDFLILYKLKSILISQANPVNPTGHLHWNEAMPSIHVPPLSHDFSLQSSISKVDYAVLFRHSIGILEFLLCYNKLNILILQLSPMNPWVQSQVYELIPSTHTPLFLHGFGWQSSISNTDRKSWYEMVRKMSFKLERPRTILFDEIKCIATNFFRNQFL